MTIYEIKAKTAETAPYYFSTKTLKFFGQTMRSFSVRKQLDGRFLISAPMKDRLGKIVGQSERFYNPTNNKLENN